MSPSLPSKNVARVSLTRAVFYVIAIVILLTAISLSWCVITGRDPGPAGDQLVELVRLVLSAGILPR